MELIKAEKMKRIMIISVMMCFSFMTFGQGIQFEDCSLQEALQKAKKENKLVFVDAYAVWCEPCKKMANTVLNQSVVGDYYKKHFVALRIDIEKGEGPQFSVKYGVNGIPDFLFLDTAGMLVYRLGGAMPLERFMEGSKAAVAASKDANNIARLALRYEKEKNDENFLESYMQKLKESGNKSYYGVFEQYLKVQKSICPSSKEMAQLLVDNQDLLVYGGEAERIIEENMKTDEWRQYVRKDIREAFQSFPRLMLWHSFPYAVQERNIDIILEAINKARMKGVNVTEGQKEDYIVRFYLETRMGEEYKDVIENKLDTFLQGLDVNKLRKGHDEAVRIRTAEPQRKIVSYIESYTQALEHTLKQYMEFVATDAEKQNVLRWAKKTYELLPTRFENVNLYANMLYLYGDKGTAISMKEMACQLAEDEVAREQVKMELEQMKQK